MNGQQRVESMYAFLVVDDDGTEGVPAFFTDGGWMPLVGADMERVESLRNVARGLATDLGKRITLVEFTTRTEKEVYEP